MNEKKQERRRILVADDDQSILNVLRLMLENEDYEVITTSDGDTASTIKKELPDLVLLDVWLSGENGGEVCMLIKKDSQTRNIPVIMISATSGLAQLSKKIGAQDYIEKPFQMDELFAKIDRNLNPN